MNIKYENTDRLLFERLNIRNREMVKRLSGKVSAQELLDQA